MSDASRTGSDQCPTTGVGRLVLFEDEHLLAVNKPAGLNTHAPAPFAGEGLFDWLRHREPRWAELAILHRLDKDTSGVMVFGKTSLANKSLTEQFTRHSARKEYVLLTDRAPQTDMTHAVSCLRRVGAKWVSRPLRSGDARAETDFRVEGRRGPHVSVRAWPITGRTHQIRVHAAEQGFPILGDELYGGSPFGRLCLHAARLSLRHPATGREIQFAAEPEFDADVSAVLRAALIDPAETDAYRLIHGAGDGAPDWYVDRLNGYLLSQSAADITASQLARLQGASGIRSIYHKFLHPAVPTPAPTNVSPRLVLGEPAPERFGIRENGVHFEASFQEGYSIGLFLDQRDNRRRLLRGHVGRDFPLYGAGQGTREMLNVFAYTCGFSVCAALGAARTTSLDLSRNYLEWGRRNFERNGINPGAHDFIYGDAFDWMKRLAKKQRAYDVVVLDPPTFSRSKTQGVFRAEKDFAKLIEAAVPLLKRPGVLFASTNAGSLRPEDFLAQIRRAIAKAGRRIVATQYAPQPPDFPMHRREPGHLKTVWLRLV